MTHLTRYEVRKGFSLLELLIVILLVSIVYFLGFESIEIGKKKPKALSPLNLKTNIVSSKHFTGKGTLLCVDGCRSCYFREGVSSDFKAYESPIDLTDIEVYTIDMHESLLHIEYGRFNDQKICLVMNFYKNGSSTQLILKNDEGSYFLPSFFGEPERFATLEEAKEHWLKNTALVSDRGVFY